MKTIGEVNTVFGVGSIQIGRYRNGEGIAVALTGDTGEPLATFSTNLAATGVALGEDEFAVKAWSENESLLGPMMASGLFEDTGRRVRVGHVESPIWRLKGAALAAGDAERAERERQGTYPRWR